MAELKNKSGNIHRSHDAGHVGRSRRRGDAAGAYTFSLVNSSAEAAYPITGYSYLLVYADAKDPAKGEAIAKYVWWGAARRTEVRRIARLRAAAREGRNARRGAAERAHGRRQEAALAPMTIPSDVSLVRPRSKLRLALGREATNFGDLAFRRCHGAVRGLRDSSFWSGWRSRWRWLPS